VKTPITNLEKLQLQSKELNTHNLKNIDTNDESAETSSLFMVMFNYYRLIGTSSLLKQLFFFGMIF